MQLLSFYKLFLQQQQRFTTDTRNINQGDVFFALKGANFNGNLFAEKALQLGASYVVVDEETGQNDERIVQVPDVLSFMQQLATHHRKQFNIPIVAIAGSNGKTTTKELLISVLQTKFKVHATKGNLNNHIGVPMTLLSMKPETEMALIEIGTNNFGEIAFLCSLLQPNYGLITNIGKEHLEGFGDLEGVAKEESELYQFLLKNNGLAFVNHDDFYLNRMSHRLSKKVGYSVFDRSIGVYLVVKSFSPSLELMFADTEFYSVLNGNHNAQNIAAAVAVGHHFGLTNQQLKAGIESYVPSNNRSEIKHIGSNHFLLDAYNANPSSMEAAIDSFAALKSDKKIILLGDMFELGETAFEEHQAIAQKALSVPHCQCFFAGETFNKVINNANQAFKTTSELSAYLKNQHIENTWFLIKGSRGMKMEQVLEVF
ncbi:MAG: UDP-N-acetylmuramoyl-tripeptide--D-alanyl-D-alanine ligase [Flavobacteriales bacterium]|nr:UDP-N-acetylmuramoyl-tripeptide--D-alanyl-D-alanine ligase [Flavobacteriales bacterium]